jgi:hypothetical protein
MRVFFSKALAGVSIAVAPKAMRLQRPSALPAAAEAASLRQEGGGSCPTEALVDLTGSASAPGLWSNRIPAGDLPAGFGAGAGAFGFCSGGWAKLEPVILISDTAKTVACAHAAVAFFQSSPNGSTHSMGFNG